MVNGDKMKQTEEHYNTESKVREESMREEMYCFVCNTITTHIDGICENCSAKGATG